MKIEVWTDGSATTKDKPGGYGWVIVVDDNFYSEGSGSIPNATNNDAELQAAIMGLAHVLKEWNEGHLGGSKIETLGSITLVSDSQIILGWASGRYRFKQEDKLKKFIELQYLVDKLSVKTRWVEGHTGVEWNERCDKLAGIARDEAMGVVRKPRKSSKPLKEGCEKMAETLEWIKREMLQMEAEGTYVRHDIEDQCDEALNFYKEKVK
jgi:ribonuclease HI